jgi:GT2 family glycosyltransferase
VSNKLLVSIIIPTYNGRKLLEQHLPRVLKAAAGNEIIVVDDASTDDTRQWLEANYPEIKVVKQKANKRFAAACNAGVDQARGEIVVLLNNDVSPKLDFLTALTQHFENQMVFAVGCAEQSDGVISGRSGGDFIRGYYQHWKSRQQIAGKTLWVSGGSGAFRKSIWEELGGMDESFAPAYEEDRDLGYRALKRGYLNLFEPQSMVEHRHETTNVKALGRNLIHLSSYKNHNLFVWKNISSARLMVKHLAWLPYHLSLGAIKTQGKTVIGFLWALYYLPTILRQRRQEINEQTRDDQDIIKAYRTV